MDNKFRIGNGEDLFSIAERINFTQPIDNEEIQFEVNQLLDELNKRTNANDAFALLHSLSLLSIQRVFSNIQQAENLIQNLDKFKISIPEIVIRCKREVNERTKYIERYFRKMDYNLTAKEEKDIVSKLEKDSFDQESKIRTIRESLYELKDQIREKEKYVLFNYGYDISELYESIIEDKKSIILNDYFYYSQLHLETIDFFEVVALSIIKYLNLKKEYYFLKGVYQNNSKDKIEVSKSKNHFSNSLSASKISVKENIHPPFNPNLWNNKAYELFKYLFENYYKGQKKRELTNMWFFLNEYDPQNYILKATKNNYKDFIGEFYKIELRNFDKAIDKYQLKEFPTMKDHRKNFEDLEN